MAKSSAEAHELVLTGFPGLYGFSFLDRAYQSLSSAMVAIDQAYLSTVRSSGHEIWLADEDRVAVLFPISGAIEVERRRETRNAGPGEVLVVGVGERKTRLSRDYLGVLIKLPRDVVQERIRHQLQDPPDVALEGPGVASANGAAEAARRYAHYLVQELDASDHLLHNAQAGVAASNLLIDLVASHWIDALTYTDRRELAAGPIKLKRAEAFIRANAHLPISMSDVASAAGASLRALQIDFRQYRSTTPHGFLMECRLQRAREMLLRPGAEDNVTQILMKSGALHLGRFADVYMARFGELPSKTLARARLRLG
ncbi:MAG: helix-turn-helix transcriptional regulator [Hyphomicrobiaceae bacterium]